MCGVCVHTCMHVHLCMCLCACVVGGMHVHVCLCMHVCSVCVVNIFFNASYALKKLV